MDLGERDTRAGQTGRPRGLAGAAWGVARRRVRWVAGGTAAGVGLLLAPDLWGLLPEPIRRDPIASILAALALAYGALGILARRRDARRVRSARVAIVRASRAGLGRLAIVVAAACAGLGLAWAPHYLTWPWCRDEDSFFLLALDWRRGVLPYRDVRAYNFPGHIYLHWLIGTLPGRGGTVPFYALDAAAVAGLGAASAWWGRRRLGSAAAGLVGYVAFLTFYLGLEFELVAERDWHVSLLATLALMAAEVWPGWAGRVASASAMALALAIRPHAVLFLPALATATAERAPPGRAGRAVGSWAVLFAGAAALAFAPLLLAGVADDLARGLAIASYGGPYSRASWGSAWGLFLGQFRSGRTLAAAAGLLATALLGPPRLRASARTWGLALLGALAYAPLHPVPHAYLAHPREVVGSIALALPAAWLATAPRLAPPWRLLGLLLALHVAMPQVPRFCDPAASLRSLGPLWRGEEPAIPPPGPVRFFRDVPWGRYAWADYLATLDHLRRTTTPRTEVANVLRHPPFPPLNGPTGRPSPFRVESGICWMWVVDEDLDARFASELERSADSVVVWDPDSTDVLPRLLLPRLTSTILRLYRPSARFGRLEVWRRSPAPPSPGEPPITPRPPALGRSAWAHPAPSTPPTSPRVAGVARVLERALGRAGRPGHEDLAPATRGMPGLSGAPPRPPTRLPREWGPAHLRHLHSPDVSLGDRQVLHSHRNGLDCIRLPSPVGHDDRIQIVDRPLDRLTKRQHNGRVAAGDAAPLRVGQVLLGPE